MDPTELIILVVAVVVGVTLLLSLSTLLFVGCGICMVVLLVLFCCPVASFLGLSRLRFQKNAMPEW